ncbi:TPA: hypothetical protein ACJJUZ_002199, partial [Neisseria meningitidis]
SGFCFFDKFLKLKFSSFPQGQKTKNRNLKFVIPTKVGIQNAKSQETVFPISFRTDRPRFPPARE